MVEQPSNNAIQLRRDMEMSLEYTNRMGFRLLEFGAETKHSSERILLDIVETVTSNPMEWDCVKQHIARIEYALKKIATYFKVKSHMRKKTSEGESGENYPTYSKVQYLEEELLRLQEEMKRMKALSTQEAQEKEKGVVLRSGKYDKMDDETKIQTEPECTAAEFNGESIDEQNRIPFDYQAIPMPPPLSTTPIYVAQQKTTQDQMKNVFTRRLPPTNSLSSAIKLGAAIKLRKVDLPRYVTVVDLDY